MKFFHEIKKLIDDRKYRLSLEFENLKYNQYL